jgi:23S rRNA (uracil1939-C5)-methyltransferase
MQANVDITIERLAYGGDGVGRLADGRVVFVPYTIPGERVRAKLVEQKARHARADLVEVIEASPDRELPRCTHYGLCGGCHYQHMSYARQVAGKVEILKEQLKRLGGLKDIPEAGVVGSPEPWNYRNHIQFHVTPDGRLGFQKARSNQAFAIQECHLPEAAINGMWPQIEIDPHAGLERISLRQGAGNELMIVLEGDSPEDLEFSIEDLAVSVVQVDPAGSQVLAGSDRFIMEVLGRQFQVSATSFFQVNTWQAQALVKLLMDQIPLDEKLSVLDVYSGVGLFSAFLASRVKRLVAIEISAEACEDFVTNLDEFDHVELYEAGAEEVLSQVAFAPDVIVMDPPRAGLGTKTVEGILAQGAKILAYVSCDPATLARDGKLLAKAGYRLSKLTFIDMFPQTYHIESLSLWERVS